MATWMRIHRIQCHAWNLNFLEVILKPFGCYICTDDDNRIQTKMDVARILVRTSCVMVLNEVIKVSIDGSIFNLRW